MKIIFLILFLLMFSLSFLKFFKKKKSLKNNKKIELNKDNLYEWMNMTKKERFDLAKSQSNSYYEKRKNLLDEIRKEYKNISQK